MALHRTALSALSNTLAHALRAARAPLRLRMGRLSHDKCKKCGEELELALVPGQKFVKVNVGGYSYAHYNPHNFTMEFQYTGRLVLISRCRSCDWFDHARCHHCGSPLGDVALGKELLQVANCFAAGEAVT